MQYDALPLSASDTSFKYDERTGKDEKKETHLPLSEEKFGYSGYMHVN